MVKEPEAYMLARRKRKVLLYVTICPVSYDVKLLAAVSLAILNLICGIRLSRVAEEAFVTFRELSLPFRCTLENLVPGNSFYLLSCTQSFFRYGVPKDISRAIDRIRDLQLNTLLGTKAGPALHKFHFS